MAATTSDVGSGVQIIALERIRTDSNIRELTAEDVDALAGSIALLGQITPAIVRPDGDQYVLVAGHKRYAALRQLGETEIRAEIRSAEAEHAERAAENVARSQLDPYQEARAVAAMLAHGLSEDGAAQALGWPKARVTARMRLLELPPAAQQMVGNGQIALSSVEQLRAIGAVSPELLDAVIAYLGDGNEWAAERLAREPGWVINAALRGGTVKVFAAHLSQVDGRELAGLKLGKKTDALYERAGELSKQLDRYAYRPTVRFADAEVDQARAAGVTIEFEQGWPLIVDRALYRELVKQAIARTVAELETKVAQRAAEKQTSRSRGGESADPLAAARSEHQRALRELGEQAHGVNLDLGASLLTGLAHVDPADITVARLLVYGLLGADDDNSPYTQAGERVARLAASGIRLVIDEVRTDATKTLKDGSRGRLRINYGDPRSPTRRSNGCGNSWMALAMRAIFMAGRSWSSRRSSTRRGWWCPPASAPRRSAGGHTRTTPPRRSRSSPARICRRRCASSRPRSSAPTPSTPALNARPTAPAERPRSPRPRSPEVRSRGTASTPGSTSTTSSPTRISTTAHSDHGIGDGRPRRRPSVPRLSVTAPEKPRNRRRTVHVAQTRRRGR